MNRKQRRARKTASPGGPDAAVAAFRAGDLAGAEALCARALAAQPDDEVALCVLGQVRVRAGDLHGALGFYDEAVARCPRSAALHHERGLALRRLNRFAEAAAALRRSVELDPQSAHAHATLAIVLAHLDEADAAVEAGRRAAALAPASSYAHTCLGLALTWAGRIAEALDATGTAMRLDPENAEAHSNAGMALLLGGEFEAGWREYAWRWKTRWMAPSFERAAAPLWDGGRLAGRTMLVTAEQGLGDTLQFVRYAPLIAARGGRVVVEAPAPLVRLLRSVDGVAEVVPEGGPLPACDAQAPLLHLPGVFATRLETIPATVPYLFVPAFLKGAIEAPRRGLLRVGLVWGGSPDNPNDARRSCGPDALHPLAAIDGIELFSLQVGPAAAALAASALAGRVHDLEPRLTSFEVTAATLRELDLVITVDTAVAHLAGALARPVWLLLPYVPDWRWLLARDDSPWYPTMRLFRQPRRGDWASAIERVAGALQERRDAAAGRQ